MIFLYFFIVLIDWNVVVFHAVKCTIIIMILLLLTCKEDSTAQEKNNLTVLNINFDVMISILSFLTLYLPDQIFNSPYCLPWSSCDVSLENLVVDQPIIPQLRFYLILITCLLDIVLILEGEMLSLSHMGVKGLIYLY